MVTENIRVTLDAREIPAWILSLSGQPQHPASGDVLITHAAPPFVLDDARTIHLRDAGRETGLVLNEDQKIACRVGHAWVKNPAARQGTGEDPEDREDTEEIFVNPLLRLTEAECARLRGVRLEAWDPALETLLSKIDPDRCALSIDSKVLRSCGSRLPPLPQKLRYLLLEFSSWNGDDNFDLSSLARLSALRVLVLTRASVDIDISNLSSAKQLRVLHASGNRIRGLQRLADVPDLRDLELGGSDSVDDGSSNAIGFLTNLRRLNLTRCGRLTSVEFVRPLQELEFLDLRETAVTDLSPLADLPKLKEVVAIRAPVRALPKRHLPSLHSFNVMSTGLQPEAVAALRRLHPDAEILHGWAEALRNTVKESDHVRVRSGGTCHRYPANEKTLVEESNQAALEALALSFEIEEAQSGGHCMCCGNPTIEFHRGGEVVAEIGLHHGRSARWKRWPGDAVLSRRSRDRLAAWLSDRGERSFSEAHEESRRLENAEEAVVEDCLRVLPPRSAAFWRTMGSRTGGVDALAGMGDVSGETPSVAGVRGPNMRGKRGTDPQTIAAKIQEELGDPVQVAAVAFKLLGCGEGSWNQAPHGGLHNVALDLLKTVDQSARGSALEFVATDPDGWEGAVRWLLYHNGLDNVPKTVLSRHIERAFRHALSHPREFNRRHVLALLGTGDGTFVIKMLREALSGLPVREADPRHANEPGGWVVFRGGQSSLPNGTSDSALAAHFLAKLGDQESYTRVCELALGANEPSRTVLLQAQATLEQCNARRKGTLLARVRASLSRSGRRRGTPPKEQ